MAAHNESEETQRTMQDDSVQGQAWYPHRHKQRNEAEEIDDEDEVEGHAWHTHRHKH